MKIQLDGQTAIQAPAEKSAKQVAAVGAAAGQTTVGDRTTFHSDGVQSLVGQALATSPVRQDRIDALRQSIANGTYQMDPGKVASAIMADAAM